ncbi:hypothetical protein BJX66DRAFT_97583 [Aspergillus keveii]|uniref:DNA2/NAM7 helicase helicase domain-containing protein n=1 Tax=Aspergillus keveii TaxID=714993 RepID=A0ABR4GNV7_9EURO
MDTSRKNLRKLRDDALARSDVVVCTAFAASMAGLIDAPWTDKGKYIPFRCFYRVYSEGLEMFNDGFKEFHKSLRELCDDTLARSDVVVCTAFAVSMTALRENVTPHAVVVYEAARFTEPELWPALTWYEPKALVLVGDHHQLYPLVFSHLKDNPLSAQLKVSLGPPVLRWPHGVHIQHAASYGRCVSCASWSNPRVNCGWIPRRRIYDRGL